MNNYIIIGRTNVGKSYFFNLFSKDHKTISIDQPHTTVDIIKKNILAQSSKFNIYDTPGYESFNSFKLIFERIKKLQLNNIKVIYIIKDGYFDLDIKVSKFIHSVKVPIKLYSNSKIKNNEIIIDNIYQRQFHYNHDGFTLIRKQLIEESNTNDMEFTKKPKVISIFGKENTGKSSLFNILINKKLSITNNAIHTTRDSVRWELKYKDINFEIIDTAGFIRSKSKRKRGVLESLSINQSENNLSNSDLIILILDANTESRLDLSLIGELQKKNKSFLILVNKMDLINDKQSFQKRFLDHLSKNHNFFNSLNIYFISILNISKKKIMDLIYQKINQPFEFKTSYLNKVAKDINNELSKVTINSKSLKIFYITAFSINNKNYFKVFTNFTDAQIKQNTKNFLRKMLINEFNLKGYSFKVLFN